MKIKNIYGKVLLEVPGDSLRGADLSRADLTWANLTGADLTWANLTRSDLSGAGLSGANLTRSALTGADLSWADLSGANLRRANLRRVNLFGADLTGANLTGADLVNALVQGVIGEPKPAATVPPAGDLVGWKRLQGGIICQLLIPAAARRFGGVLSNKCRAEYAIVTAGEGVSEHDSSFLYRVGETVKPSEPFDPNPFAECSTGIHFFLSRAEADSY
jgi:hypothetical protein